MAQIIYNQWSNSNVVKSKANDFYTNLRVAFDFDSNFESTFTAPEHSNFYCTYTTTGESARVASIKNHGLSGGKLFVDIQTAPSLTPGAIYTFTVVVTHKDTGQQKTAVFQRTQSKVIMPLLGANTGYSIKPFTDSGAAQEIQITNPSGLSTLEAIAAEYNIDLQDNWFSVAFHTKNSTISLDGLPSTESVSADYITKSISFGADFFNLIASMEEFSLKEGRYILSFSVTIKNVFGKTITTQRDNKVILNFDEPFLVGLSTNQYGYLTGTSTFVPFVDSATKNLREGLDLIFKPTMKFYNGSSCRYSVLRAISDTPPVEADWEVYAVGSINFSNNSTHNNPTTITENIRLRVPEISEETNWYFKIRVEDERGNVQFTSATVPTTPIRHTKANISLLDAKHNGTYDVVYTCAEAGLDLTRLDRAKSFVSLQYGENLTPDSSELTWLPINSSLANWQNFFGVEKTKSLARSFPEAARFENIRIKIRTVVETTYENNLKIITTKESFSPIFTLYGSAPTLRFRENHLGINNESFNSDDVLVVSSLGGRRKVRFIGHETGTSNSPEIEIDLNTGKIGGAIIDGGEW